MTKFTIQDPRNRRSRIAYPLCLYMHSCPVRCIALPEIEDFVTGRIKRKKQTGDPMA